MQNKFTYFIIQFQDFNLSVFVQPHQLIIWKCNFRLAIIPC